MNIKQQIKLDCLQKWHPSAYNGDQKTQFQIEYLFCINQPLNYAQQKFQCDKNREETEKNFNACHHTKTIGATRDCIARWNADLKNTYQKCLQNATNEDNK